MQTRGDLHTALRECTALIAESRSNDWVELWAHELQQRGTVHFALHQWHEACVDFTVAVEEEFALLDPASLDLVNRFEEVKAAAQGTPLEPNLVGELIASEVEVKTGRCETFAEIPAALVGGTAPLVATALVALAGGAPWLVAAYLVGLSVIGLVGIAFLPETLHRADVDGATSTDAAPTAVRAN